MGVFQQNLEVGRFLKGPPRSYSTSVSVPPFECVKNCRHDRTAPFDKVTQQDRDDGIVAPILLYDSILGD